jgi:hypothetical protein
MNPKASFGGIVPSALWAIPMCFAQGIIQLTNITALRL